MKESLFHINWGDGDNCFIIAADENTARGGMSDGRDMVNFIVRLDAVYKMIFEAGQKQERERIIQWGIEPCPHWAEGSTKEVGIIKRDCSLCWRALGEEE